MNLTPMLSLKSESPSSCEGSDAMVPEAAMYIKSFFGKNHQELLEQERQAITHWLKNGYNALPELSALTLTEHHSQLGIATKNAKPLQLYLTAENLSLEDKLGILEALFIQTKERHRKSLEQSDALLIQHGSSTATIFVDDEAFLYADLSKPVDNNSVAGLIAEELKQLITSIANDIGGSNMPAILACLMKGYFDCPELLKALVLLTEQGDAASVKIATNIKQQLKECNPFELALPFKVYFSEGKQHTEATCTNILRYLPDKRLACVARLDDEMVFVKFFFDKHRSLAHLERELAGIQTLNKHAVLTQSLVNSGKLDSHQNRHSLFGRLCPTREIYYIIYKHIDGVKTLRSALLNARNDDEKVSTLSFALKALAQHHRKGIIQKDMHLDNFLLSGAKVYTIDGDAIKVLGSGLSKEKSCEHVGNFLAQLFPRFDVLADKTICAYFSARGWELADSDVKKIKNARYDRRVYLKNYLTKKSLRDCTHYSLLDRKGYFIVFNRRYSSSELITKISNIEETMAQGELLKDGNTCTVVKVRCDHKAFVIKRYNIKNVGHGVTRALKQTRAKTSWINANVLELFGLRSSKAVALVEKKAGPFNREAYFISEFISDTNIMDFLTDQNVDFKDKTLLLDELEAMFSLMKQLMVSHGDMKHYNILVNDGHLFLIDLDSLKQHQSVDTHRQQFTKDIERLIRSFERAPDWQAEITSRLSTL